MTQPLALIFYEQLLPGSQLVNRLQDLGYRVLAVTDVSRLAAAALKEKPMVLVADLRVRKGDILAELKAVKANAETEHVPVLGFAGEHDARFLAAAQTAGVALVARVAGISEQLPQLLEHILRVE
jgi:PleD family two-component response regulator